ncbi:MAG: 30S ribosomal protein S2 [Nitrososphaeria archaeon]
MSEKQPAEKQPEDRSEAEAESRKVNVQLTEGALIASGIRIGTNVATKHMKPFVARRREDGLNILDINKILSRIEVAGKFLSRFDPKRVLIYTSREAAYTPIMKFAELTGVNYHLGRLLPGTLTNPYLPNYKNVDVVMVVDPAVDKQAIEEAIRVNIPVIAICDTNNVCNYVDLIIPGNNRGRKALAMIFWLLARSYLINSGALQPNEPIKYTPADFETKFEEGTYVEG